MIGEYRSRLEEAVDWLNLSIEGKHKRGLSLLTEDKEMAYLVLNGDAEHIDFGFPGLRGSFEEDGDSGIASDANLLDEIRDREQKLQEAKADPARV